MKAKKKPLEVTKPADYGVEVNASQNVTKVEEPPARQGGTTVPDVDALVEELKKAGLVK